jgi:hypothetical protein
VQYAKRKDCLPDLLPLLEDSREGPQIDPASGVRRYVRVQDLAAYTIAELLNFDRSECKMTGNPRHEQMDLDKLRMLAVNALMTAKDP